jgi:uncharacterized protein
VSAKCPNCAKPRDDKFKPFCSKRCADLDLGRWLNGTYAIPAAETDDSAESLDDTPDAPLSPARKS